MFIHAVHYNSVHGSLYTKHCTLYTNHLTLYTVQGKSDVIWATELRDRVNLNIKSDPTAFLTFLGVEERDEGMYRYIKEQN